MDKCIFSKKHMFCILGARWHKILAFVTSFPIYGWLAWWCDFFPVGPTFEDHPHVFSQKRSSPLDFIFDTCASASSSHLFWLVKLNICGCRLFNHKCMFSQKSCVLHCGRALTQNYWICPIMSYLWMVGLVMRLFSCWANFWRSSACIQPKKVQPLGFYFWHLSIGLFKSPFLVGEAEHMWLQPFARANVFSTKNMCFAFWARVDTKFFNLSHHVLSMDGCPGDATFPLWGQPLKIMRMYSGKKRSSPLDFIFDTCAWASSGHLFGWWSWTYVVVAFC